MTTQYNSILNLLDRAISILNEAEDEFPMIDLLWAHYRAEMVSKSAYFEHDVNRVAVAALMAGVGFCLEAARSVAVYSDEDANKLIQASSYVEVALAQLESA